MYKIFDIHTHTYPEKIADKATVNLGNFYNFPVEGKGTYAHLESQAEENGVHGYLLFSVATNAHQVSKVNDSIASLAEYSRSRGFLTVGFAGMHQDFEDFEEEFEVIVDRIRKYYNDAILTTDIIVGFPDESAEEFEKTYEYLKRINFYKMHVFKYSPRKGTKAAEMKNQIPGDIKEIRSKKLLELSDNNEIKYLDSYIGKEVEVLFEEFDGKFYKGHTANYIMVKVKSEEDLSNKMKMVKIIEREDLNLIGK